MCYYFWCISPSLSKNTVLKNCCGIDMPYKIWAAGSCKKNLPLQYFLVKYIELWQNTEIITKWHEQLCLKYLIILEWTGLICRGENL